MDSTAHPSPADVLPDDVWFGILELAYAHRFPDCHTDHYAMDHFPIPFSHASRRFRGLVLSMPKLWACVHITYPQLSRDISNMIEMQLIRSGNHPLTILLSFHETIEGVLLHHSFVWDHGWTIEDDLAEYHGFRECWDLIRPHSHRWRHLAVYLMPHKLFPDIIHHDFFGGQLSMPSLEHLEVYVADGDAMMEQPITLNFALINAPELRTLRTSCLTILEPSSRSLGVSELFLANSNIVVTYDCLADFTAPIAKTLTTLVMHELSFSESPSSIALPRLEHLSLSDMLEAEPLLAMLLPAAPRLARLELTGYVHDIKALFATMSSQSLPSVKTIVLWGVYNCAFDTPTSLSVDDLFLDSFTGLRHLVLYGDDPLVYGQELLRRSQSSASTRRPLWPHLERLSVGLDASGGFPEETEGESSLREFVKHRSEIGHRIRTLCLCDVSEEVLIQERMQSLKELSFVDVVKLSSMATYPRCFSRWNTDESKPHLPQWTQELAE